MIPRIGDEVQRLSVVHSIPDLLLEDNAGCVSRVFPKMQQVLPSGSTEFHVAMSQTVQSIVLRDQISIGVFVQNFLPSVISSMDNRDQVVANAWSETLLAIMDYLPLNVIQTDIIPLALGRSQLNKSVPVRISSCRIIGKAITRLDPVVAKKDLVPTVLSLCQDVNGEVRAAIASELEAIIKHVGAENSKTTILASLIELSSDEIRSVKEAAFTTTVTTVTVFPQEIVKHTFIPLINQMLNFAFKVDDHFIMIVSALYGKMCLGIKAFITPAEKEAYLGWYTTMADSGTHFAGRKAKPGKVGFGTNQAAGERFVVYRQNCAQNFPSMVQFCWDDTNEHLFSILQPTISELVSDSFFLVRRTMACGLLDVAKHLDKASHKIRKEFLVILRDDSEEVLEGLMPRLSALLLNLLRSGAFKKDTMDSTLVELNRALIKCEGILASTHNWRLYTMFLKELEVLHALFPSEVIFNSFIALFFKRIMSYRAVPVRLQAIRTILVNLRYLQKVQHRTDVRNRIINDLKSSRNFYDRMLYVRACEIAMELFSTSYFKDYFFFKTISLVDDPVPNIRWGLCRMLPKLKAMAKLGTDRKYSQAVDSVVAKLSEDRDREVLNHLNSIKTSLDKADPSLLFPNDAKLYDEESNLPSDYSKTVETRISAGSSTYASRAVPQPPRRPAPTPSTSSLPTRSSGSSSYSRPPTSSYSSSPPVSLNDEKFLVDAGVILSPHSNILKVVKAAPVVRRLPVRLREANENTPMKTCLPKPTSPRQGIPIRQPKSNNNSLQPPQPTGLRDLDNQYKRHSIEVMDVNKNLMKPPEVVDRATEGEVRSPASPRRQSHLPRPLSCINFPAKSDEYSKARPVSRLPVLRQRL